MGSEPDPAPGPTPGWRVSSSPWLQGMGGRLKPSHIPRCSLWKELLHPAPTPFSRWIVGNTMDPGGIEHGAGCSSCFSPPRWDNMEPSRPPSLTILTSPSRHPLGGTEQRAEPNPDVFPAPFRLPITFPLLIPMGSARSCHPAPVKPLGMALDPLITSSGWLLPSPSTSHGNHNPWSSPCQLQTSLTPPQPSQTVHRQNP